MGLPSDQLASIPGRLPSLRRPHVMPHVRPNKTVPFFSRLDMGREHVMDFSELLNYICYYIGCELITLPKYHVFLLFVQSG